MHSDKVNRCILIFVSAGSKPKPHIYKIISVYPKATSNNTHDLSVFSNIKTKDKNKQQSFFVSLMPEYCG